MRFFTKLFFIPEKKELNKIEKFWKIPELKELTEEAQTYETNDGLKIKINKDFYIYEEPILTKEEKIIYEKLERGLFEILNLNEEKDPEERLKKTILLMISELNLKLEQKSFTKIYYHFRKNFIGLGKIEAMLMDPLVTKLLYKEGVITLKHKIYGICKTDIKLENEESEIILRKATASCNIDWPNEEEKIICENPNQIWEINTKDDKISFTCEEKKESYLTPEELVKQKKISIEMLAYFWMILEAKKSIFINNDKNILFALSFFLPAHITIRTDTNEFPINQNTTTIIGESLEKGDFAFLTNLNSINKEEISIVNTTETISEIENIICYTESGIVKSLKEYGQELFKWEEGRFLFSLEESMYIASKGNKTILLEEFKIRTKLINVLFKNHLKEQDFKKVIAVYYENPQLVIKKAGIQ